MNTTDRRPGGGTGRGVRLSGFTLIELLVTISIIALLMGIIVPAAAGAREAARGLACKSNLKQINLAWAMYMDAEGAFPIAQTDAQDADARRRVRWGWGGAQVDAAAPEAARSMARPVNAYIDGNAGSDSGADTGSMIAEVTQSPADDGLVSLSSPNRAPWPELGLGRDRRENTESLAAFEAAGTSYFANEWLYCKPGALVGFFERDSRGRDSFSPGLGLRHSSGSASDLILLGGAGWSDAARYTEQERAASSSFIWEGFWFGPEATHFAFADGSVRDADLEGAAASSEGTFYLRPGKHRDPNAWRRADGP